MTSTAEVADREHGGWRVTHEPTRYRAGKRYTEAWIEHLLRHDHGSRSVAATDEDIPKGAER